MSNIIVNKFTVLLAITSTVTLAGFGSYRLLLPFQTITDGVMALRIIQPYQTLKGHSGWIYAIAISPDGNTLASGSYNGTIKIWNLPTGKLLHTFKGHADAVASLAISPDRRVLASGSWDNRIKLWNLETGTLIRTLEGHKDDVEAIAISSNGKLLASSSADNTIKLWNLDTGKELLTLQNVGWVKSVAFSPDSQKLASGGRDNSIKIWQLNTGNPTLIQTRMALRKAISWGEAGGRGQEAGVMKSLSCNTFGFLSSFPSASCLLPPALSSCHSIMNHRELILAIPRISLKI